MENICKNYLFLTGDRVSIHDAMLTEELNFKKHTMTAVNQATWATVITSKGSHIGEMLKGLSARLPSVQFTLFYAIKLLRINGMAVYQAGQGDVKEESLDFPMAEMNRTLSMEIFSGFTALHLF